MMTKNSIICFLLALISVFPFVLKGQSHSFSGHISNDTVWANMVLVDGNVYVDNGNKLTITPGTTIEFQGFYKIEVNGSLQAMGTESDSVLFTIADTTGFSNYSSANGAWDGIRFIDVEASNDSSIFRYCKIQYSKAVDPNPYGMGGAILYLSDTESKLEISNCLFQNNIASYDGGAISIRQFTHILVVNSIFRNNRSLENGGGGAIDITEGYSALISGNIIYGNQADWGGGISISGDSHSYIVNNLIYDNFAGIVGGGLLIGDECYTKLTNNTICNNSAWQNSGGVEIQERSDPIFKSNIIWGNTASVSPQCGIADDDSDPDFYNCDIQGGFAGIGGNGSGGNYSGVYQDNIDADPLFLNQTNYPYSLSSIGSPGVDAGFPDTTGLHLPEKDLAGNARVYSNWENSLIDIGAYEFQKTPKLVSITPEDGSTIDVASLNLTIEFDSPITKQSGNITIYNGDGSVFEIIHASTASINSQTVTISHNNLFVNHHNYYINIENTAFDDGYGNYYAGIEDDSTWNYSVVTTDSFAGAALDLDGSNDYVEIADDNSLDLTNNYTIEAWIKPKGFGALDGIVSKYQTSGADGYYVRLHPDSPHTGFNFDGMKTVNGILVSNEWYHIAAINDSGTRKLYLNGELQSLSGTANTVQSNSDFLGIGVDYLQSGRYFHGEIDEVRIWNVVRTENEIRENINLTLSGFESGLVSYWQFNDASGTHAAEIISGNSGILHNMNSNDWVEVNIPVGKGTSNTQMVSATGIIDFSGTSISMDFTQKSGSDSYVVTHMEINPNINPDHFDDVFDSQYWIFKKYGTGTFQSNITFSCNEELYPNDENNPSFIQLYKRSSNSETNWQISRFADSVNSSANFAIFNNIDGFSQFLLTRYNDVTPPYIADSYPKDNSYNSPIDSIQIFFNEVVNEVNGKSISIYDDMGVLWNSYTIPSTQITGSGTKAITINFGSELGAGNYYVHIDSAVFTDLNNNSFACIQNQTDWNFVISADGNLAIDTTWLDHTYINRDLLLIDDATITIAPGTRIEFEGYYLLNIKGRLLAVGTKQDSILFTTPSSSDLWNRLHFDNTPTSNDTSKISYCIMEQGHTSGNGGAIYINNVDKLIISRSTFRYNYAYTDGGAVFVGHSDPIVRNNEFHHNQTQLTGGALTLNNSNSIVTGNLFHHNETWNNGGAVYMTNSNPVFLNNTLVYNKTVNWGGGLNCENNSNPIVQNSIIQYNVRLNNEPCQVDIYDCDPDFYYNIIGTGFNHVYWNGHYENNVNYNPLFSGDVEHPYSLQKISPCINLGNPDTTTDTIGELDIAGNARILSGRVDIGAYEQGRISDGFAGTALEFAGTGDYVNLPDNGGFDFSSAFTVETWVNYGSMSEGEHTIIKNGDAWEIKTLTVPDLILIEFGINDNDLFVSFETDSATMKNNWNHIACVFDPVNSSMIIYLNGIAGSSDFAMPLSATCDSVTFGGDFVGKIDEFRVWNTARTIDELRSNMHLTLSDLTSGITTFLQFNEGAGTTVKDLATGYDGNLVNMISPDCWINSSMPAGDGISNTQIVYATGNVEFSGTGVMMDFTEKMWSDTIVTTKIENAPNLNPHGADAVFDNQYWIVNKFGSGTFKAHITFSVNEDLGIHSALYPEIVKLYSRESNSDENWTLTRTASQVDTAANSVTFEGITGFRQFIITRENRKNLDLTVFLEGAFNGTDMNTYLTGNPAPVKGFPLSQPYNTPPWNYFGNESVTEIPTDVVDWVLIELRDTTTVSMATSETMIAQQAAFILNDGKVVGVDGTSTLFFNNTISHSLFVVIWHRNHLGIISANPLSKTGSVYTYDFTTPTGQALGTNSQKNLGSGYYGMISADANSDGNINTSDKFMWENQAGTNGYKSTDFNMNGQVNNPDKDELWVPNEGKGSQVPE